MCINKHTYIHIYEPDFPSPTLPPLRGLVGVPTLAKYDFSLIPADYICDYIYI